MEIERNNNISPSLLLADSNPLDIPVIDLSNPNEELVARAVVKASQEWGIFQVVNHEIPTELIRRLQEVGKEFLNLPEAEKEVIAKPEDSMDVEGYRTKYKKDLEGRNAWVDHLFHRIWPPSRVTYTFWPKNSQYKEVNEEYASHLKKLSERVMEWLSEGLGLRREALKEGLGGETVEYLMKINYYPPCEDRDVVIGAPDHTDVNAITFLVDNEVLGLQAFKDEHWIDAKCATSGIIVIIGDQFMRMSNGKYKSAKHRATMDKEKTRISWAVFVESNLDHVFGPLPELITGDDEVPKFKPYVYKDFKFRKLKKLLLD